MIGEISGVLTRFESCFTRKAAFSWFVVIVFGLLVRLDQHGVTSLFRWLGLEPDLYVCALSFFRASSWTLADLQLRWSKIVKEQFPLITVGGYLVIIGDGIKISKEARKMPGVKKLHQDSANSGKAEYIFGHHHGVLGILAGSAKKLFCVPLAAEIHEGMQKIRELAGKDDPTSTGEAVKASLITSMTAMACNMVKNLDRKCILVLDAYFAVGPAFLAIKGLVDAGGNRLMHLITRAKGNVVAFEEPERKPGRAGGLPYMAGGCPSQNCFEPEEMSSNKQKWKPTGSREWSPFCAWISSGNLSRVKYASCW